MDDIRKFHQLIEITRKKGQNPISSDLRQEVCLQVISTITQIDRTSLNLAQFTEKVTNLIRDNFGLYFVGLYLLDMSQQRAIFYAGSGDIGSLIREVANPISPGKIDLVGD